MYVIKDKAKNKYVKTNAKNYPVECNKHIAYKYKTLAGAKMRKDFLNSKCDIYGYPANNFTVVDYDTDNEM